MTRYVDADGVRFAFRRFGSPGATPLVMLQHFRGNLDNWDPAFCPLCTTVKLTHSFEYDPASSRLAQRCIHSARRTGSRRRAA